MTSSIGALADLLVAVLLIATIVSSLRLSRRMGGLQAHEGSMRATIAELVVATENAERAIGALRASLAECDHTLLDRLEAAERSSKSLGQSVRAGETLVRQLDDTIEAVRSAFQSRGAARENAGEPRKGRDLSSVLAGARALAERSASRVRSGAA